MRRTCGHQQDQSEYVRKDQVQQPQRHVGIMPTRRSPLASDPGPTSGTPQAARDALDGDRAHRAVERVEANLEDLAEAGDHSELHARRIWPRRPVVKPGGEVAGGASVCERASSRGKVPPNPARPRIVATRRLLLSTPPRTMIHRVMGILCRILHRGPAYAQSRERGRRQFRQQRPNNRGSRGPTAVRTCGEQVAPPSYPPSSRPATAP